MTAFTLKIIAMICMSIDHIGAVNPQFLSRDTINILRVIGRLSFPIFFLLIIEGFKYTSDIKKYIKSLYTFGLISAIPFYMAFGTPLNVFFTLGSIVFMLDLLSKTEDKKEKRNIFFKFFILNIACDWGAFSIPTAYLLHKRIYDKKFVTTFMPIYLSIMVFIGFTIIKFIFNSSVITIFLFSVPLLFSIPLLKLYNGEVGIKLKGLKKYFFYIFYPLHLIIITLLFK